MQSIYIPHIEKAPERTRVVAIAESITGLDTLTPVKGRLRVQHRGNFLEVTAQASAIMTLSCDRCLQNYNSRIEVDASEIIWLQAQQEDYPLEREVSMEELMETLSPQGHFDPEAWLYEQFCLAIPQRKVCGEACPGPPAAVGEAGSRTDARWAALSALKGQFPAG